MLLDTLCMSGVSLRTRPWPALSGTHSSLSMPPTSTSKDDQSSSRLHADELRATSSVPWYLRSPQSSRRLLSPWSAVTVQRAHQRGVNCQVPAAEQWHSPSTLASGTSKSRTNAFVLTRPPACLQMRAAAHSNEKPRRLSTPARTYLDEGLPLV